MKGWAKPVKFIRHAAQDCGSDKGDYGDKPGPGNRKRYRADVGRPAFSWHLGMLHIEVCTVRRKESNSRAELRGTGELPAPRDQTPEGTGPATAKRARMGTRVRKGFALAPSG